jgi:hypothetical protein
LGTDAGFTEEIRGEKVTGYDLEKLKGISKAKYEIVRRCKGKKTLELGCVNHSLDGLKLQMMQGNWLFGYLDSYCSKATGMDITPEAVDYLRKRGFDVRFGDAQSFELDEKFEIIIASALLDHLLNFDGFFKSCQNHVEVGGELIVFEDNILSIPALVYGRLRKGRTLGMHGDITMKPLSTTFGNFAGRYGFKVKEIKYFPGRRIVRLLDKFVPAALGLDELLYDHFMCVLEKGKVTTS